MDAPDRTAIDAIRFIRRHCEGTLLFDDRVAPVRFIVDGATGGLILALEPVALTASNHVLFVPEERDGAAEVMLSLAPADRTSGPHAAACDRWEAYHGRTPLRGWAAGEILGCKWDGQVFDGDEMMRPDPFWNDAAILCGAANDDPGRLGAACRRAARVDVADPLTVGVDPWGIDVRARFGIVRLEFEREAISVGDAEQLIEELLGGAP